MNLRGLGQNESIEEYWMGQYVDPVPSPYGTLDLQLPQVEPVPSAYGELTPPVLTPYTIGPLTQEYSQVLAGQTDSAKTQLDAANKTLSTLISAGAGVAQLAVAKSAVSAAQSAVTKAQQAQAVQSGAAGAVSGCAITIIPGVCNSYVYIGGAAVAAILLMVLMKRR